MRSDASEKSIFFITGALNASSGGRAQSIFSRARLFSSICARVTICTMDFKSNYASIYNHIAMRYSFRSNVNFCNIHEFLSGESYAFGEGEEKGESTPSCHKVFRGGQNEPIQERYYDSTGRLYLIRSNDKTKGIYCCQWIKKNGDKRIFPTLRALRQFWISSLADCSEMPIFSLENRHYDSLVIENPFNDSLRSIALVHDNHLSAPFVFGSGLTDYLRPMLERLNLYDSVVFLTEKQRNYVANQFGPRQNHFVIPHPLSVDVSNAEPKNSNSKTIVMLARLVGLKRVDHAIKAMKIVVSADSDIELHIYGTGEERDGLVHLAAELGLSENVFFEGYTDSPERVLADAALSVMTSKTEALCLSVQESLALGTPVVAYDCNFGPSDLIVDGENGRLVPSGDIDGLANAILDILQNDEKLHIMSKCALESSRRFSDEAISAKWEEVTAYLDKNDGTSFPLAYPVVSEARIQKVNYFFPEAGRLRVSLEVLVKGCFEEGLIPEFYLFSDDSQVFNLLGFSHVSASSVSAVDGGYEATFLLEVDDSVMRLLAERADGISLAARQGGRFWDFYAIPNFFDIFLVSCFDSQISLANLEEKKQLLYILRKLPLEDRIDIDRFDSTSDYFHPLSVGEFETASIRMNAIRFSLKNIVCHLRGSMIEFRGDVKNFSSSEIRCRCVLSGPRGSFVTGFSDTSLDRVEDGFSFCTRIPAKTVFSLVQNAKKSTIEFQIQCYFGGRVWQSNTCRMGAVRFGIVCAVSYKGVKSLSFV